MAILKHIPKETVVHQIEFYCTGDWLTDLVNGLQRILEYAELTDEQKISALDVVSNYHKSKIKINPKDESLF